MRSSGPSRQSGFRRAVVASAAAHLVAAAIIGLVMLDDEPRAPAQSEIDTRVASVHIGVAGESAEVVELVRPVITPAPSPDQTEPPASAQPSTTGRPPTITSVPGPLSPEIQAVIRRSHDGAMTPFASDPSAAPAPAPSTHHPSIAQASASTPAAPPLHGAMAAGRSVVYLLDCSGSMGEFGKLDRARDTLLSTLQGQQPGVRVQIVTYNSTARLLLPSTVTSAATLAMASTQLGAITAAGRSNHVEGLRMAASLRPDYIVWLTDADDLAPAKLKPVLASAEKPMSVYIAAVTARGVESPRELSAMASNPSRR